jgi:L-amino acid N-acyltransferase YncA
MMISFRDAVIEDLPTIVAIYNSTIPGRMVTADTEPFSVEAKTEWFYEHNSHSRPIMVLEVFDTIVGWLSFSNFKNRPAYSITAEISIYIHEDHRRKRMGYLALEKAIEECPRLKIRNLLGFIFAHNEPSLNLFYKFGFDDWAYFPSVAIHDGIERDLKIVGKNIR